LLKSNNKYTEKFKIRGRLYNIPYGDLNNLLNENISYLKDSLDPANTLVEYTFRYKLHKLVPDSYKSYFRKRSFNVKHFRTFKSIDLEFYKF
jgi:hypothetical protein